MKADPKKLAKVKPREYLLRFAFGGALSVIAWLVGKYAGKALGGMFLAFPAILPASLTLVKQHDGRADAIDEARGARAGVPALAAFAVVVTQTVERVPAPASLALATVAWSVVAVATWWVALR